MPIVDLVHHTSYPDWLRDGFRDRDFAPPCWATPRRWPLRYPWLPAYTLFNEPFATLFLAGHEGLWPPYDRGHGGFVRLLARCCRRVNQAAECWAELLPDARHVWVDTAEHHAGSRAAADYVELANDRRHIVLDLMLGHDLDPARPFLRRVVGAGGGPLLDAAAPGGSTCSAWTTTATPSGSTTTRRPRALAAPGRVRRAWPSSTSTGTGCR